MASINDFVNRYLGGAANAIASVLDTIVFIEFIYEETLQTALFAAKQAMQNKDYDTAQKIVDYILFDVYPSASAFLNSWGDLAPYSKACFSRFYEAAALQAQTMNDAIPRPGQDIGVIHIYTNIDGVDIYVDGELKGQSDSIEGLLLKLEAGSHGIEAKKEGYETGVRQVNVEKGTYRVVKINLVKT